MKTHIVLTLCIMVVLVATTVSAEAIIGVSPSRISFEDVLRGGYAEKIVTITVSSDKETTVTIEPRGDIAKWLEFSEEEFTVTRGQPHRLRIAVNPPEDSPNQNYTGFLRLKSVTPGSGGRSGATGTVIPVLDLFMIVEITDIEFVSCIAKDYGVHSVEEGEDLFFTATVANNGNIRLNPKMHIDIWDQEQQEILASYDYDDTQVAPTTQEALEIAVPTTGLELGQYWAEISSLDCFSQSVLTFDVLEEGSLRAEGVLQEMRGKTWVDAGETVQIDAVFRNTGEKDVTAYFKGSVTLGDRTIQLIESEQARVAIGNEEIFTFFFTPTTSGRYIASGRVFYDNKRTYEKSTVVNVRKTGLGWGDILKYTIYIALIAGIVYLTYKIRQEKRKYNRDLRILKKRNIRRHP